MWHCVLQVSNMVMCEDFCTSWWQSCQGYTRTLARCSTHAVLC